jgi:hypothetical protein
MVVGNSSKLRTKTDDLNHFELTAYTSEHGPHKFNV